MLFKALSPRRRTRSRRRVDSGAIMRPRLDERRANEHDGTEVGQEAVSAASPAHSGGLCRLFSPPKLGLQPSLRGVEFLMVVGGQIPWERWPNGRRWAVVLFATSEFAFVVFAVTYLVAGNDLAGGSLPLLWVCSLFWPGCGGAGRCSSLCRVDKGLRGRYTESHIR